MPDPFNPVAVAVPLFVPHDVSVLVAFAAIVFDPLIDVVAVAEHPVLESVTVTLYVPAVNPVIVCVKPPLLHT